MAKRQYSYTARGTYDFKFDIEVGSEEYDDPQVHLQQVVHDRLQIAIDAFDPNRVDDEDEFREHLARYISDTMRNLQARVAWVRVTAAGSGVIHRIEP